MVDNTLKLPEYHHPSKEAMKDYNLLVGIDEQKKELLKTLSMLLDHKKIQHWEKKFHGKGLPIISHLKTSSPLVILSGEVGCGKTALAQSIGTPLAELLKTPVKVFETPSNIRGSGLVGEISNRITEVFEAAKARLKNDEVGLLIIDEADDIATSRAQNQAHHEDRAGLNVLIKQIDSIKKSNKHLAVIMITNRVVVLDPAIRRRTSLHLLFERPTGNKLEEVLTWILNGTELKKAAIDKLIQICNSHKIPYSYSDLIQRVAKQTLYEAVELDVAFSVSLFEAVLGKTEPTPLLGEHKLN
jgi:SpoVK/Ycf46/Vps4 family AAA+-type ATPase